MSNLDVDFEDEPLTPSPDIEFPAASVSKPKKSKSKKTGSAIHSITVKKNRMGPKAPTIEKEVKPKRKSPFKRVQLEKHGNDNKVKDIIYYL